MNFDNMQKTGGNDNEYDFDDFDTVEWPDEGESKTVVGELLAIVEDVGKYDTDVILLSDEDGDDVMVWSNGAIGAALDRAEDLEVGDNVGIRQTGDTYENKYGTFKSFDVRYQKA